MSGRGKGRGRRFAVRQRSIDDNVKRLERQRRRELERPPEIDDRDWLAEDERQVER